MDKPLIYKDLSTLAEREGFEPSVPLRGTHDFQSCALDQLSHLSIMLYMFVLISQNLIYNNLNPALNQYQNLSKKIYYNSYIPPLLAYAIIFILDFLGG